MTDRSPLMDLWAWRSDANAPAPNLLAPQGQRPEMRPGPTPTLRDRVFDYIYGALGGTPSQRSTASALTDLADFATLGVPTSLDQGVRDVAAGQGPFALGMALVPGAKLGKAAFAPVANAATRGIRAYHGSPHDFSKFDLSKIGTGEGAQAYGHGLYFAENEAVAKGYRKRLSSADGGTDLIAQTLAEQAGGWDVARKKFEDEALGRVQRLRDAGLDYEIPVHEVQILQALRKGEPGRMYEVKINADPERFLDWDKAIGDQTAPVRDAILDDIGKSIEIYKKAAATASERRLPATLAELQKLERERSYLSAMTGGQYYESSRLVPGAYKDKVQATQSLREAGIPGIRYKDAMSRDLPGGGTSNYVVFDDTLVEILRKYGLLPAGLTGAAAATMGADNANAAMPTP